MVLACDHVDEFYKILGINTTRYKPLNSDNRINETIITTNDVLSEPIKAIYEETKVFETLAEIPDVELEQILSAPDKKPNDEFFFERDPIEVSFVLPTVDYDFSNQQGWFEVNGSFGLFSAEKKNECKEFPLLFTGRYFINVSSVRKYPYLVSTEETVSITQVDAPKVKNFLSERRNAILQKDIISKIPGNWIRLMAVSKLNAYKLDEAQHIYRIALKPEILALYNHGNLQDIDEFFEIMSPGFEKINGYYHVDAKLFDRSIVSTGGWLSNSIGRSLGIIQ